MPVQSRAQDSKACEPWQLAMFRKGLKKRPRLKVLKKLLTPIAADERHLLLTCGDDIGAMNHFLREVNGKCSRADLKDLSIGACPYPTGLHGHSAGRL